MRRHFKMWQLRLVWLVPNRTQKELCHSEAVHVLCILYGMEAQTGTVIDLTDKGTCLR